MNGRRTACSSGSTNWTSCAKPQIDAQFGATTTWTAHRILVDMARGWESKSVESQIDSAAAAQAVRLAERKRIEVNEEEGKIQGFMLSRTRVLNDIHSASNPRYVQQLERALAFLDQQIAALGGGTPS